MRKILERQGYHLAAYVLLGAVLLGALWRFPAWQGRAAGLSTAAWVALSWGLAGIFQFWIAFFWRLELHRKLISATMGRAGFVVHCVGYVVLGVARFATLVPIALSSPRTVALPPLVSWAILVVTTPLCLWALHSAAFYFGLAGAAGADHFDPAFRHGVREQRGIYKYVRNPMYAVALLLLYHPGLFWHSAPGLLAAAVHHAFVWVHYVCTEKPDLEAIYG